MHEWSSFRYLFINISRSKKYMCRVTKSCVFKLLQNLENSLQNYSENPGNCVSGIPDFKIFTGEHGPPLDTSPLRREIVPPPPTFNALAPPPSTSIRELSWNKVIIFACCWPPRDRNYKIRKFKNTYTQDNKQLFQKIGQIHGAVL